MISIRMESLVLTHWYLLTIETTYSCSQTQSGAHDKRNMCSTYVCLPGNARYRDVSYYIIVDIHNEKQLFAIISTILDPCNHPQLFESVISSHRRESIIPMCINPTSNPYTSTMNKTSIIFAILGTVLVVTISLMNGVEHADPFG
jgi:hypothetical protein